MTVKKKNSFLQTKENNRAKPVAIVSNQKHTRKLSQLNCTLPLHLYFDLNCSSCSETHNQKKHTAIDLQVTLLTGTIVNCQVRIIFFHCLFAQPAAKKDVICLQMFSLLSVNFTRSLPFQIFVDLTTKMFLQILFYPGQLYSTHSPIGPFFLKQQITRYPLGLYAYFWHDQFSFSRNIPLTAQPSSLNWQK